MSLSRPVPPVLEFFSRARAARSLWETGKTGKLGRLWGSSGIFGSQDCRTAGLQVASASRGGSLRAATVLFSLPRVNGTGQVAGTIRVSRGRSSSPDCKTPKTAGPDWQFRVSVLDCSPDCRDYGTEILGLHPNSSLMQSHDLPIAEVLKYVCSPQVLARAGGLSLRWHVTGRCSRLNPRRVPSMFAFLAAAAAAAGAAPERFTAQVGWVSASALHGPTTTELESSPLTCTECTPLPPLFEKCIGPAPATNELINAPCTDGPRAATWCPSGLACCVNV